VEKKDQYFRVKLSAKIAKRINMSKLNQEQIEAVSHFLGPCLVSACPGAGKTRVITFRAIHLIKKNVLPSRILLVTFTNKAAREMNERISKLAKEEKVCADGMSVSTFHRMCLDIMKRSKFISAQHKRISILDTDDVESIVKSATEDCKIFLEKDELKFFIYLHSSLREKALEKEEIRDVMLSKNENYPKLMDMVEQSMENMHAMDFSGIMYNFWKELKNNDMFRKEVQEMYDFVMIDEVQDTNVIQFEISKIICEKHNNIFMVGDTDQSIYQWRGANPSQVAIFVKSTGCKVYRLSKNYRCTANINKIASSLIKYNSNRLNSEILSHRDDGSPVEYSVYCTRDEESDNLVKKIVKLKAMGIKMKDVAILIRAGHLTRSIEQSLVRNNIAYSITGGFRFYDREEIKDVISMIKFFNNPRDVVSFARFMNKPRRGLGTKSFQAINSSSLRGGIANGLEKYLSTTDEISESNKSVITNLIKNIFSKSFGKTDLKNLTEHLIEVTSYKDYIKTFKDELPQDKMDNIAELLKSMEVGNQSIEEFLTSVSLMSSLKEASEEDKENSVKVMTMHAAKGLEFDNVFLPCLEESILPHRRSLEDGPNGLEEERRLAYVAITRAMNRLYMSNALFDGMRDKSMKMPSRFLFEGKVCDKESYYDLAQAARNAYMA
jgi:DNA helicase II / ATP-dependent DNA helicase PcrA